MIRLLIIRPVRFEFYSIFDYYDYMDYMGSNNRPIS